VQTEGCAQVLVECEMQSAIDRMVGGPVAQASAAGIVVSSLKDPLNPKASSDSKKVFFILLALRRKVQLLS
jgi:hypothetical protein